jgi:hypothetical protein
MELTEGESTGEKRGDGFGRKGAKRTMRVRERDSG